MMDIELFGVKRVGAVYLIKGGRNGKSCLVDTGTGKENKGIIQALDAVNAFPPDMIILTHSHWDHAQGVPGLCTEAQKRGRTIQAFPVSQSFSNRSTRRISPAPGKKTRTSPSSSATARATAPATARSMGSRSGFPI